MKNRIPLTALVIPISTSASNEVEIPNHLDSLLLACQASALTGTVTIQFSFDAGVTYQTYKSGGSNVAIGALECIEIPAAADKIKLASSGTEAAARNFALRGVEEF